MSTHGSQCQVIKIEKAKRERNQGDAPKRMSEKGLKAHRRLFEPPLEEKRTQQETVRGIGLDCAFRLPIFVVLSFHFVRIDLAYG
jgi:hypothetical protein